VKVSLFNNSHTSYINTKTLTVTGGARATDQSRKGSANCVQSPLTDARPADVVSCSYVRRVNTEKALSLQVHTHIYCSYCMYCMCVGLRAWSFYSFFVFIWSPRVCLKCLNFRWLFRLFFIFTKTKELFFLFFCEKWEFIIFYDTGKCCCVHQIKIEIDLHSRKINWICFFL